MCMIWSIKKIKEPLHNQEAFQYISGVLHAIHKFRFSFEFSFPSLSSQLNTKNQQGSTQTEPPQPY